MTNEEDLQRELQVNVEMLAFVLYAVGEPVRITKEMIAQGLPSNLQIRIDEDLAREEFVFYLAEEE